jgi:hypothetical protein
LPLWFYIYSAGAEGVEGEEVRAVREGSENEVKSLNMIKNHMQLAILADCLSNNRIKKLPQLAILPVSLPASWLARPPSPSHAPQPSASYYY